jgi:protein-L-isoaspartate(D-aspartate) O-methyltransferase
MRTKRRCAAPRRAGVAGAAALHVILCCMDDAPRRSAARLVRSLRRWITDERVLAAIATVPREQFVAPGLREEAYENIPLPIGCDQTISQPLVIARMCEVLALRGHERVLDVGTGSGYHAAILAALARWVWGVERHTELAEGARRVLQSIGIGNVTIRAGDGCAGWPEEAPFDAINVAAAAWRKIPPALEEQLAPGGRLIAPVQGADQRLVLVRRRDDGALVREELEPVRFVPLI